jgi:tetratricopeptide (TPR) repeat protein
LDKYEYRVKTEQMQEHMEKKQYKKAMEIADTIDWRRVKNVSTLNTVSEIYEYNGEYQKSRDILFVAFDRSPGSRKIAYRLGLLALRIGDIEEAADCYEEFVKLAPKDPNQYILKYKILRAQGAPIGDQISALEDFKKAEYIEKWAYELARLYHEAGMTAECLEECDDLILWFSEGRYVYQAMELKMQYKPLTPLQQEKFDSRPGAARKARPVKKNTSAKPPVPLEEVIRGEAPVRKEVLRRVTETALRADQEALEDEEAQKESIAEEDAGTGQNTSNFGKTQSISKVVKGATLQEALANGMALANGIRSVEKTVAKVKEGIRQVTGQIHMDALVEKRGADAKKVEPAPKKEPEKVEVKEEKKEPKAAPAGAVRASRKPAPRPLDKKTDALRVTGQMRIEEILQEWEAKQKANAEAIERQREEDDERLRRERDEIGLRKELERREAEKKAAEERKALEAGATQRITPEGLQKLAEREALRKAAERKAAEEAAARKAAEEEAARKAAERKAAEEAAARKAAEEEAARKAAEEEAARKAAEEEAARRMKEEAAEKEAMEKAAEEEAARKAAEERAAREFARRAAEVKAAEEVVRKAAEAEAARKAAEKEAALKVEDEEAVRKAAEKEAALKVEDEEAVRKAAEKEELRKAIQEEAARIAAEEEAARKAAKEEAARKAEEDTAKKAALKNKAVKKKVKQTTKENIAAELPEDKPVIEVGGKTQRIPDDIVRLMEELGGNSAEFGDIDIFGEPAADEKLISEIVENRYQGQDAEGDFDEGDFDEDDLDVEDYGEYELEDELGDTEDEFEEASKESDGTDDFMEDKFQEKGASEDGFEEDGTIGDFADIEDDFGEEASKESDDTDEFEEEDFDTEEDFQEDEFEEDDFGEEDTFDAEDEFEEEDFEEAEEDFEEEDFEDKVEGFEEEEYEEEDFEEEDDFAEEDDFEEEDDFAEEDDFEEEDSEEEDFEEEGFEEEEFEEEEYEEEDFDDVGDYIEDSDADYGEDDFGEEEFDEDEFEEDSEDDFEEEDFEEEDLEEDDFEEEDFDSGEFNEGDLEIEEPSEEEIQARIKKSKGKGVPFDTGFVVTGRYDLSATSEIGLKAGLTEEQKKLFSYFVPVRGMSEQLVEVLDNDRRARKEGTSKTGNLLVIGRKGSGKTVLAVDIVKAIQKQRNLKQGKVAIVTGESLNKKELTNIIQKLRGGAIIIEKAGKLNSRTIKELNHLMEKKTGELLFVLEDQRKPLERILTANPEFKKKFTSRLELPVFINDELVTFGQTYAKENGYKLDEMGILALYSRIDVMQREDHAVSVAEVKDIMDEAIEHSQKANVKHLARRVFGKSTDESDRIILKEEDFRI